jgi:hypothetical protein
VGARAASLQPVCNLKAALTALRTGQQGFQFIDNRAHFFKYLQYPAASHKQLHKLTMADKTYIVSFL